MAKSAHNWNLELPREWGPNINDDGDWEAGPNLSHDGLELFFVGGPGDKLYSATRETTESEFGPRQTIRRGDHPSVSADGLSLYFHEGNPGNLWVMTRDTIEDEWGHDENLGPTVNSQYKDRHPSISADGLGLYFTSDRPGEGTGNSICVTKRENVESSWEEPVELGPHINSPTAGSPDISADGLTLFFSSRRGGFGDIDIWMATRETTDRDWGEPVNLGPDINTAKSDVSPHLSADGSEFYFSRGTNFDDDNFDLWRVPVILPPPEDALQAGDADQNHSFDQLDIVQVLQADKYLTGETATWGEGDWDGAPGGGVGDPPPGNGLFDQLDIVEALASGLYMTGPSAAVRPEVNAGAAHASVGNDATIGEIGGDAPDSTELTSASIDSAAGGLTLGPAENLGGSFDNDSDPNVFKATFASSFGTLSIGNVAQAFLEDEVLLGDLTVVGSLAGVGDLGDVDLMYISVPEPASILLLSLSVLAIIGCGRMPR